MTRIVLEHAVQVFADDMHGYRAECECGWASDWFADDEVAAEEAGIDHREVAVRAPDGTDAAISDLLDIQDDITTAVTWLAEHWPGDLPALNWSGDGYQGNERPALRLTTYCLDTDELGKAAELLGVTPVDDERVNSYGDRYRRVRRRFGHHIEVEAFTAIGDRCSECGTSLAGNVCPNCGQRAGARDVVITTGAPA